MDNLRSSVAERLKEINANRPCNKCVHKFNTPMAYFIGGKCSICNFNHDNFEPAQIKTGG